MISQQKMQDSLDRSEQQSSDELFLDLASSFINSTEGKLIHGSDDKDTRLQVAREKLTEEYKKVKVWICSNKDQINSAIGGNLEKLEKAMKLAKLVSEVFYPEFEFMGEKTPNESMVIRLTIVMLREVTSVGLEEYCTES